MQCRYVSILGSPPPLFSLSAALLSSKCSFRMSLDLELWRQFEDPRQLSQEHETARWRLDEGREIEDMLGRGHDVTMAGGFSMPKQGSFGGSINRGIGLRIRGSVEASYEDEFKRYWGCCRLITSFFYLSSEVKQCLHRLAYVPYVSTYLLT